MVFIAAQTCQRSAFDDWPSLAGQPINQFRSDRFSRTVDERFGERGAGLGSNGGLE
jgi:hypothetical protein